MEKWEEDFESWFTFQKMDGHSARAVELALKYADPYRLAWKAAYDLYSKQDSSKTSNVVTENVTQDKPKRKLFAYRVLGNSFDNISYYTEDVGFNSECVLNIERCPEFDLEFDV